MKKPKTKLRIKITGNKIELKKRSRVNYRETVSVLFPLGNTLFFIPLPFNKLLRVPSADIKKKDAILDR